MNRNLILILTVVAVVGGYFFYVSLTQPEYDIRIFAGRFIGYDGSTLTLNGIFESESDPVPDSFQATQDFTFRVDESTVFEKEIIAWPPDENLKEQRKLSSGSLEDLKSLFGNAVYIKAAFPTSLYKKRDQAVASHLIYRVFAVSPSQPVSIPIQ